MIKKILFFCLFFFINSCFAEDVIKVGIVTGPPISYQTSFDKSWHGVAISLWEQVANQNGWTYHYYPMGEDGQNAIKELSLHHIDILIGPMTVTPQRLQKVDFSRPFIISKVVVFRQDNSNHFLSIMLHILGKILNVVFLIVLIGFFIVANLLWLFERKHVLDYQKGYLHGIIYASWALLMLLVGSQLVDKPQNRSGRLIILFVIFISIIFSSLVSAVFTSSLTLSLVPTTITQDFSIKDIQNKTFGGVYGQAPGILIQNYGGNMIYFNSVNASIQAFVEGRINNLVGDKIIMQYAINQFPEAKKLDLTPIPLLTTEYSFAFPKNSPYKEKFDYVLTTLQEENKVESICLQYLSKSEATSCVV